MTTIERTTRVFFMLTGCLQIWKAGRDMAWHNHLIRARETMFASDAARAVLIDFIVAGMFFGAAYVHWAVRQPGGDA